MNPAKPLPLVIWFIGISGAGKTTLARRLHEHLLGRGVRACLLDGDEARAFFDHDLGYSKAERMANIKRILFAAHMLSQCGVAVVVANISPFEEIRQLARRKMPQYREIYLRKNLAASRETDVNGIYRNHTGKTPLVGVEIPFEEPVQSNLTIDVDRQTPEESFRAVLRFLKSSHAEGVL
jgi:adenylylsulfate kinase-like enzyme